MNEKNIQKKINLLSSNGFMIHSWNIYECVMWSSRIFNISNHENKREKTDFKLSSRIFVHTHTQIIERD